MSILTSPPDPIRTDDTLGAARARLAIVALAMGAFAIGTTEFVTMGLLPDIAATIGTSIPTTGHIISAYALGVVIGAPLIVSLGARLPRRELLLGLVAALGVGNVLTAVAGNYPMMLLARFIAGLPHGAYFGVSSLIAASLVSPGRRGRAVSSVMLGLAVANVAGVPASTWVGQTLGWRSAYALVVGITVLTAVAIIVFVPHRRGAADATVRRELRALRQPQVLLTAGVGAVGFGGMFAMYSYIAPTVTDVTHMSAGFIPWMLLSFGAGGVLGTALGGRLADRALFASLLVAMLVMGIMLAVFAAASHHPVTALAGIFAVSVTASVLVVCLQMRLMEVAGDAEMLGAALNHVSLNIANALGAWIGSIVIAAGYGYTSASLAGAVLAVGGLVVLLVSAVLLRRERLATSLAN